MDKLVATDPVLARFRAALDRAYGQRVERVVLFGSRARGDARPDSDYDVAVFLRGLGDRWRELDRLADISTEIVYALGGVIHATAFPARAYEERTPIMHDVRLDGIDL